MLSKPSPNDVASISDPDNISADRAEWTVTTKPFDEGKNTRLLVKLNLSTNVPFFEVIEPGNGMPPIAIAVVRADMRPVALGILDELKMKLYRFASRPDLKSKLASGVGSFLKKGTA